MASVMAIGSEVVGECVAGIRIEVERKMFRIFGRVLSFWFDCLSVFWGLLSGCVDCNGAR